MVLAVVVAVGCAPRDRDRRLARVAAEKRSLEATLDRLEDRLLVDQARVRYWREMRARHESVSAIACAVQDEHERGMAEHTLPPERSSLHRAKVAAASTAVAKPQVRTESTR
jgi:hypothetical protein